MRVPALLRRPGIALGTIVLTFSLAPVAPAAAAAPEEFTFDNTFAVDFLNCGEAAHADVHETGTGKIRFGNNGFAYFWVKWEGHVTLTRTSTHKAVTLEASFIDRDAKITDNGDGTITIVAHSIINERDYAPDGTLGLRTVGRETAVFVIDLNGTPANFDDDEEVSSEFVSFTGRDDREDTDFCDWYLAVTA